MKINKKPETKKTKPLDANPEVDLLIAEVDEDLRKDVGMRFLRNYGKYVVMAAIAIVIGVGVREAWHGWKEKQRDISSQKLNAANQLFASNKINEGLTALAEVEKGSQDGFALLARMQHAAIATEIGNISEAIAVYEAVYNSSAPKIYRELALIKQATITIDQDDEGHLYQRLSSLTELNNPWHLTATELLALFKLRHGHIDESISYYKTIADDITAPQEIRMRASEMLLAIPKYFTSDKAKG